MTIKTVKLPSGAVLEFNLAPFKDAKDLYQAILEEAKQLRIDAATEIDVNLFKDIFCAGMSSKKIEACLWQCLKRATYNSAKITEDTFEPEEARGDYMSVCVEVTKENVLPFVKSLYAEYSQVLGSLKKGPA